MPSYVIHSNLKEGADLFYFFSPPLLKDDLEDVLYVSGSVLIAADRLGNTKSFEFLELII